MKFTNRARMTTVGFLAAALGLGALPGTVLAKPMLRYVGELADARGRPQNGTFLLRFRIFDAARGGSSVWEEARYVSVLGGRFATPLGSEKEIPVGVLAGAYRLSVEVPPGTGWSAKAVMAPAVIGGAARKAPAPAQAEAASV
ncbi:hypothetical protein ACFL2T_08030, partial [Elusimicrobiota bacterium]